MSLLQLIFFQFQDPYIQFTCYQANAKGEKQKNSNAGMRMLDKVTAIAKAT